LSVRGLVGFVVLMALSSIFYLWRLLPFTQLFIQCQKQYDKQTGEVVDCTALLSLDMEKINQELALLGYYTLMTSEIEMDDHEVIDKYHGLSRIEAAFRIIKTDLSGRPVFLRNENHINAHFLICFIALTMISILQHKILVSQGKTTNSTRDWETGLSAERIKNALESFIAETLPGGYFRLKKPSQDLCTISQAFNINPVLRLPTEPQLRALKSQIDHSTSMRLHLNTANSVQ